MVLLLDDGLLDEDDDAGLLPELDVGLLPELDTGLLLEPDELGLPLALDDLAAGGLFMELIGVNGLEGPFADSKNESIFK